MGRAHCPSAPGGDDVSAYSIDDLVKQYQAGAANERAKIEAKLEDQFADIMRRSYADATVARDAAWVSILETVLREYDIFPHNIIRRCRKQLAEREK